MARTRGWVVRKLIENDGADSCSYELAEKLDSEELEKNYHKKKRQRSEEEDVDQKLKKVRSNCW